MGNKSCVPLIIFGSRGFAFGHNKLKNESEQENSVEKTRKLSGAQNINLITISGA